jgi:hypothetical protein
MDKPILDNVSTRILSAMFECLESVRLLDIAKSSFRPDVASLALAAGVRFGFGLLPEGVASSVTKIDGSVVRVDVSALLGETDRRVALAYQTCNALFQSDRLPEGTTEYGPSFVRRGCGSFQDLSLDYETIGFAADLLMPARHFRESHAKDSSAITDMFGVPPAWAEWRKLMLDDADADLSRAGRGLALAEPFLFAAASGFGVYEPPLPALGDGFAFDASGLVLVRLSLAVSAVCASAMVAFLACHLARALP